MLLTCTHCEGFVPKNVPVCPHCGAESLDVKVTSKFGSLVKGFTAAATGGVVAVTLMACYGGPPFVDNDGDGFDGNYEDCNDQDAATHPGAPDTRGDGVDQNCDGVDGIDDSGTGGSAGSSGSSTSSGTAGGGGSGGGGGPCVTSCNNAVNSTGLVSPGPFCSPASAEAFDALQKCACTTMCSADCGSNICTGVAATPACSTCVQTNCSTANLDCQEN